MSPVRTVVLPDLGEGSSEAEIVTWHVNVGDRVVMHQPLLSVETSHAIVEIPSPAGGTVTELRGEVGDRVNVGDAIVELGEGGPDRGALVGRIEHGE